jgi:hypothetical protein
MSDRESRLGDEDVQKVLARALELQGEESQALTIAQVREIASDLAIPESAVDRALSEYRDAAADRSSTSSAAPAAWERRRRGARILMLSVGVVGSAFVLLVVVSIIMRL